MEFDSGLTYAMPLEVYLQAAVIRGVLETNQDRLSNYLVLRQGDEVFSLRDATLENLDGKAVTAGSDEYLIYMQEVYLIADLTPQSTGSRSALGSLYVKKESSRVLLSAGPYSLQGKIHLVPGGMLHDLLTDKSSFVPVTDAILLDRPEIGRRTYLVNRTKIGFMTSSDNVLTER